MKLLATIYVRPLLLISTIVLTTITSCRKQAEPDSINEEIAAITDTLRAGRAEQAIRMTEELKRTSLAKHDSAAWSEAMVQQGVNAYYMGNPLLLLASSDSALNWLERQKTNRRIARLRAKAYQNRGAYYDQYSFNPDSTALYFRKAVDNMVVAGVRAELPQAYANYANAMRMGASLDSAALYYHRAITIADSLGLESEHYIPLYNGIASVFNDMQDYDNSALWWKKSLGIMESMNQFDKFNTLTGYGNHLYYKEDYEGAKETFVRLRKMLDSIPGADWETMFTTVNLADTYIRTGKAKEGKEMLDTAGRYFTDIQPNPMVMSYIQTLRMYAATRLGEYSEGLELAKRYPEADTLRLEQHLARLKALEELYANIGNYRQAYATRTRYDHLNDSLRSYHLSQQMSALNAQYERDHRILNLEADSTLQQARIYKLTASIAIAIAVIVGLILFFTIRRINTRKREQRMMNKIITLRQENLRNRITPHFIYNALNHELYNERLGKPSHLHPLADLIRKQQILASEILIPFAEELKFTDDYIKVVSDDGRSGAPFSYEYSIEPTLEPDFPFPSMTLQILVENAFKHGFSTLPDDTARVLRISVTRTPDNRIAVSVFNNSGPSASTVEKGGTGLRVLLETIKLINERNRRQTHFTIDTKSEFNGIKGCHATITLPENLRS